MKTLMRSKLIPSLASPLLDQRQYANRILSIQPASLIAYWPLWEAAGLTAYDRSSRANNATYASSGITYGQPGIGDSRTAITLDGNNTYVNIDTVVNTFDDDWNGNLFSMVAWGKVDAAARWTDATSYRYLEHFRATDATYYAVMGKSQTNHQLEWRRRSGGAIVSYTHTFSPSGPTGWFCMGMTHDQGVPYLRFYLWDSLSGFRLLSTSNSASLTDWGANPPVTGATVLGAGSLTLQEWIGSLAHCAVWSTALTTVEMQTAMTP